LNTQSISGQRAREASICGAPVLVLLAIASVLAPGAQAQNAQEFHGKLDAVLHADDMRLALAMWGPATSGQMSMFVRRPAHAERVRAGTLEISETPRLRFTAALVTDSDGQSCLFVDKLHTLRFTESDKTCFHPLPGNAYFSAEATLELPLPPGPYRSLPVIVKLPRATPAMIDPHTGKAPTLLFSSYFYVDGSVQLPTRTLDVRYAYTPGAGSLDPGQAVQYMDTNGDGKMDEVAERDVGEGKAPVFKVGDLYLTTSRVDLRAKTVTLISVSASEYKRFDLAIGAQLPDFQFREFNGQMRSLSSVKGKYVLLDFWATWCAACVADMSSKKAAYAKFHDRGFEILGMDGDAGTAEEPARFLEKLGVTWPQAKPSQELLDTRFHIVTWPTEILIDSQRRIVSTDIDALSGSDLDKTLGRLLPPAS
jgi:peroxiredoxin